MLLIILKTPMSKTSLVNLARMAKRFCIQIDGYKSQVDNDLEAGNKILHNFQIADRVIDDDLDDTKILDHNLRVIKEYTNSIPKIANANIVNFYLFTQNIVTLCKLNLRLLKTEQ